jgi:hypothetical protein
MLLFLKMMNAANDSLYTPIRNRSLPIPSTITCVPQYPDKLKIYMTPASSYWQAKCFHRGRVHTRSLRTEQKQRALSMAKEFFNELMARSYTDGVPEPEVKATIKYSFRVLAEQMLAQERLKVLRGEMAQHSLTMLNSRLNKHVIPYFGEKHIGKISTEQIAEFVDYLTSLELSSITLSQYIIALRKVFNLAVSKDIIRRLPQMPKIKVRSTPRGGFTVEEYKRLLRTAKQFAKREELTPVVTHRNKRGGIYTATDSVPQEFAWLIGFMVNSFVRPVDIKLIQHKHVQVVRSDGKVYLRLTLPETKRHKAQIVTLRPAVRIYEQLKRYMAKRELASAEDYLFLPEIQDREAAIYLIGKYFRKLLEATKLRKGNLGQSRTIYSLRHTAITFRLLYGQGIDLLTLARNARTSVEMIERFYASELSAEMNIDMLQSRR